jgi:hypothetical protein
MVYRSGRITSDSSCDLETRLVGGSVDDRFSVPLTEPLGKGLAYLMRGIPKRVADILSRFPAGTRWTQSIALAHRDSMLLFIPRRSRTSPIPLSSPKPVSGRMNRDALSRIVVPDTQSARFLRSHPDMFVTGDWKFWFDLKMKEGAI